MNKYLGLFFIGFALISSCSKEKDDDVIINCYDEDIGEFYLLPTSWQSMPYDKSKNQSVVFEDSSGAEWEFFFKILPTDSVLTQNQTIKNCWERPAEDIKVHYKTETRDFSLFRDKDEEFSPFIRLTLSPVAYIFEDTSQVTYADEISVFKNDFSKFRGWLRILVDQRTLDDMFTYAYNDPVSSIQINNKTFTNVYTSEGLNLCYNYEKGIVAFRDSTGNFWTVKD